MTRARELADLLTGGQTIATDDNTTQLTLSSTDADANVGPVLDLVRDSGSPADSDNTGAIVFKADDDGGNSTEFAKIETSIIDASNTTEDGRLLMRTMTAGTATSRLDFTNTETVFNDSGIDVDFRVESDGNANMLFVDASADAVGVGTNSPTLDSSLAGLSVSSDSTLLHINDSDGACLKLSDPASGSNRGLGIALQGTSAVISNCESGELRFGTGNTERMRISSGGAIGINESSPSTFLHIDNGGSNGSGQADAVRLHNPGTTAGDGAGIKFSAGSSTTGAAIFGIGQALNSCNLIFRSGGDTERMRLDTAGKLLINETSTNLPCKLHVNFNGSAEQGLVLENSVNNSSGAAIRFVDHTHAHTGGGVYFSDSNNINYATSSDARLKENVADMTGSIDRVKALAPKRFNFISNPDITMDGFLAHEAQTVVPEAVNGTENAVDDKDNPIYQAMDAGRLVPLLTGALKEAIAKIETLETKVAALEAE